MSAASSSGSSGSSSSAACALAFLRGDGGDDDVRDDDRSTDRGRRRATGSEVVAAMAVVTAAADAGPTSVWRASVRHSDFVEAVEEIMVEDGTGRRSRNCGVGLFVRGDGRRLGMVLKKSKKQEQEQNE